MSKCRMCSQRLTRPGKLCRECERELQRARAAAESVDTLSSAIPVIDAARVAEPAPLGFAARLRSRPSVLAIAFSVGIASAAVLYFAQDPRPAAAPGSVMLDRDLSGIRARGADPPAARIAPARPRTDAMLATAAEDRGATPRPQPPGPDRRKPVVVTMAATASQPAPATYDRVLALAHALDECAQESLFGRIACEHRARMRYCEGAAGRIPQCLQAPPRDAGQ
jgi:hypothetical protein